MEDLPLDAHPSSPKVISQPHLCACLAFMAHLVTDFRVFEVHLHDHPYWREVLSLKRVTEICMTGQLTPLPRLLTTIQCNTVTPA